MSEIAKNAALLIASDSNVQNLFDRISHDPDITPDEIARGAELHIGTIIDAAIAEAVAEKEAEIKRLREALFVHKHTLEKSIRGTERW